MRIIHLLLIGILISLTAATASSKNDNSSKKTTVKPLAHEAKTTSKPAKSSSSAAATTSSTSGRSAKSLKSSKAGENRGKRTLYDFNNPAYLYPQIAARRAGFDNEPRSAYSTQSGYFNGQNAIAQFPSDYHLNYSPYPQYLEAPEPIIEIIIKDANDTLPETSAQPIVTKTKKKKEKVHVFYVNYKKDQNNKLHLESPIASLNNDETEEEEEEEEIVHYPVTPLPPVRSTTLRTIIHPDSEKYHSNSGIHVTFGSEDKSQSGHILEEHDAESVQSQVVALPVPHNAGIKPQFPANARNDFQGQARSPFSSSFFQSSAPWQYQAQQQQQQFHSQQQQQQQHQTPIQQQQLPNKHSSNYFKPPSSSTPPQHGAQHSANQQHHSSNYHQKPTFHQQPVPQKSHHTQPVVPQPLPSSNRFSLSQIHQQLQQQSQYYVNHNQLYPTQPHQQPQPQQQHQQPPQHHNSHQHHQQQSTLQHNQYFNAVSHKPSQAPPKSQVVFPTAPPKTQELPVRHNPQPYQPIKFRPTPAAAPQQTKPTPIAAKLENIQYNNNNKLYQFQKQPQYIQHPTFTITSPTLPPNHPSNYKTQIQLQPQAQQYQQQQHQSQHQYQTQNQAQIQHQQQQTIVQPQSTTNSLYYNQNKQQHNQQAQQQQTTRYQSQSSNQQSSATLPNGGNLSWLDIKPSKETELLKSIPKFEQHITETVENHYNTNQYQTQSQVLHDMPAPNLGPQQQQQQPQSQALQGHYITASNNYNSQPQVQQQQSFSNFVTASSNLQYQQQYATSTQAPQYAESTDGQKIMIVTPMPPNVYQQYQAAHAYQTQVQNSNTNQQQSTQIINSIQPSQEQYNNYYQQPRQGQSSTQAQSANNSPFSVSNYHSDVFKELEQRNTQTSESKDNNQNSYIPPTTTPSTTTSSTTVNPKTLSQLPDEVPDELRQQLLSSGILGNADISVLDYDKQGDIALENLPAEHLQHFYGAGGGAQISESKKVLSVLKPNGDKVSFDEKEIERVKESNSVPHNKQTDVKVVRYDGQKLEQSEQLPNSGERQYNRYLPLKINGVNFPKPDSEDLQGKTLQSVVVLAPVDTPAGQEVQDTKEVKFLGGDLIKTLVKKPTKENFKRWLEKEARTDAEQQSVVLLVAKSSNSSEQEIFMYDITTGEVNKLNGELSSKFVSVAEENASTEDLEHGSTLDPNFMETMMQPLTS